MVRFKISKQGSKATSGKVHLEISEELIGVSGEAIEPCLD